MLVGSWVRLCHLRQAWSGMNYGAALPGSVVVTFTCVKSMALSAWSLLVSFLFIWQLSFSAPLLSHRSVGWQGTQPIFGRQLEHALTGP